VYLLIFLLSFSTGNREKYAYAANPATFGVGLAAYAYKKRYAPPKAVDYEKRQRRYVA